jgi:hypothetical protein
MSASGGHWRCAVTPITNISLNHGAKISSNNISNNLVARYTSGNENAYFDWVDYDDAPPEYLADIFSRYHPEIVDAGYGKDQEYADWYELMLNLTEPDFFPIAYADWDLPSDYLETTSLNDKKKVKIPIPPPGVAIEISKVNHSNQSHYFSYLSNGKITDYVAVKSLLDELRKYLSIEPIPEYVIKKSHLGPKITEELTRLPIYLAKGLKSWGGLVIGFPGSKNQLTSEYVGTPYLRRILYPILDLYKRIQSYSEKSKRLPCIYILGERFPDVFLRKFRLLEEIAPHVIILTKDLIQSKRQKKVPKFPINFNEQWVQAYLCQEMASIKGLEFPIAKRNANIGLLTYELSTWEGTKNPERLDILGYDKSDHSLIAIEIKGPSAKRLDLQNLFFQGLQHRDWLEQNKMAIKLIFDGPRGKNVSTRKRVRLILGFFGNGIPSLFYEMRDKKQRKDKHIQISFVEFICDDEKLHLKQF